MASDSKTVRVMYNVMGFVFVLVLHVFDSIGMHILTFTI
jgi:hypothetical protein